MFVVYSKLKINNLKILFSYNGKQIIYSSNNSSLGIILINMYWLRRVRTIKSYSWPAVKVYAEYTVPVWGWIANLPLPRLDLILYCTSPLLPASRSTATTCLKNKCYVLILLTHKLNSYLVLNPCWDSDVSYYFVTSSNNITVVLL